MTQPQRKVTVTTAAMWNDQRRGELLELFRRRVGGAEVESGSDFAGLLLIESEDHLEVSLETGDEIQGLEEVLPGALFRIGEVEEDEAA